MGAKLYVPESQRLLILEKSHDSKTTGHFGFVKTLHLIKCQFWCLSLKKDIQSYVASCPVCTLAKKWQGKTPGLLQPVAEPSAPWKVISMDFIVELPESSGNTKQVHFVLCQKILSSRTLAKLFIHHIHEHANGILEQHLRCYINYQ